MGPASQPPFASVSHVRLDRDRVAHVENDAVRAGVTGVIGGVVVSWGRGMISPYSRCG